MSLRHPVALAFTLCYARSLADTHIHTHTHAHTHINSPASEYVRTIRANLGAGHIDTHTHSLSDTQTHTHILSHTHSLSPRRSCFLSSTLILSLSYTHSIADTHTQTHIHNHLRESTNHQGKFRCRKQRRPLRLAIHENSINSRVNSPIDVCVQAFFERKELWQTEG